MKRTTFSLVVALCLQSALSHVILEPLHPIVHDIEEFDHYAYPRYAFDYAVHDPHTGDHKHQWEERDGDFVKGEYGLVEPDGSLRIVQYTSHPKHGFSAEVKKVGPSIHPDIHHHTHLEHHHIPEIVHHEPHLIPIIRKPIGKRYAHAIKKVLHELPIPKKLIYHEEGFIKPIIYKPFKPLKFFIDNVVKKYEKHEKPAIHTLFEPHGKFLG